MTLGRFSNYLRSEWEKLLIHNIHSCYEIVTEALNQQAISLTSQFGELVKAECADVTHLRRASVQIYFSAGVLWGL